MDNQDFVGKTIIEKEGSSIITREITSTKTNNIFKFSYDTDSIEFIDLMLYEDDDTIETDSVEFLKEFTRNLQYMLHKDNYINFKNFVRRESGRGLNIKEFIDLILPNDLSEKPVDGDKASESTPKK